MKYFFPSLFLIFSFSSQPQNSKIENLTIEQHFLNPPTTANPYVWLHWMGSSFSKFGNTKDFEAIKVQCMGGAIIFNLYSSD